MKKIARLLFTLSCLLPILSFSQKAYEAIYYSGKTQNIQVVLTLANGYLSASEIKTTDNATKKTSTFLPVTGAADADKKMKFDHNSSSGKKFTDYFILDGIKDNYEKVPTRITGKYYFNGTAFNIIFTKR